MHRSARQGSRQSLEIAWLDAAKALLILGFGGPRIDKAGFRSKGSFEVGSFKVACTRLVTVRRPCSFACRKGTDSEYLTADHELILSYHSRDAVGGPESRSFADEGPAVGCASF